MVRRGCACAEGSCVAVAGEAHEFGDQCVHRVDLTSVPETNMVINDGWYQCNFMIYRFFFHVTFLIFSIYIILTIQMTV